MRGGRHAQCPEAVVASVVEILQERESWRAVEQADNALPPSIRLRAGSHRSPSPSRDRDLSEASLAVAAGGAGEARHGAAVAGLARADADQPPRSGPRSTNEDRRSRAGRPSRAAPARRAPLQAEATEAWNLLCLFRDPSRAHQCTAKLSRPVQGTSGIELHGVGLLGLESVLSERARREHVPCSARRRSPPGATSVGAAAGAAMCRSAGAASATRGGSGSGDDGDGGRGGIRTPDARKGMPHFECGAFNRSATLPSGVRCDRGRGT